MTDVKPLTADDMLYCEAPFRKDVQDKLNAIASGAHAVYDTATYAAVSRETLKVFNKLARHAHDCQGNGRYRGDTCACGYEAALKELEGVGL